MYSNLSPRRELGEFKKRYKWMALFVFSIFLAIFGRVAQLQIFDHDKYDRISLENITKTIVLPASRGVIRDTKGRELAVNRPAFNVYITPHLVQDEDVERIALLMGLSQEAKAEFRRRLEAVPAWRRTHQLEMFTDISREQMAALETHSAQLPGLDVVAVPLRYYPFAALASHAIGYLNEVNAEDIERLPGQGYRAGEKIGRTGIERSWESVLRGRRGFRRVMVDARGRVQERLVLELKRQQPMHREPTPGRDLTLTLDMDLMRIVEKAFRGQPSGAAVLVDVRSGRVRAMFSKPAYDLNEMTGRLTGQRYRELTENPFRPLIDKTVYESYFPGSTFKPISALAALGDHIVDPASRVECTGSYSLGNRRFRCTQAHGDVDMQQALVRSCNVYFYRLAEQVGLDRLDKYAREFGLGSRTGIGINSEATGFIPTRSWYQKRHGNRFRVGFTLNAAIGQGNTRATLLQIAMAYAAIANGGTLYLPQLVEKVNAASGATVEEFAPRARRLLKISKEHMELIRQGLIGVVNDPNGTAYEARIAGGPMLAGKTGTAEVVGRLPRKEGDPQRTWYFRRDHAWFAGFAPVDDPQLAVVVLVEHGGAGGKNAAPIAVQIVNEFLGKQVAAAPGESNGRLAARAGR